MTGNSTERSTTTTRDPRLDGLRGLAIVLVVTGHTLGAAYPTTYLSNPVQILLYSFHLPLFAAVSGYVARGREGTLVSFVVSRFRALMIPYIVWYLVWSAVSAARDGSFEGYLTAALTPLLSPRADNALWFLYALFLASVAFRIIHAVDSSHRLLGCSLLLMVALFASGITSDIWLFDIDRAVWLFIFFAGGYLAAHQRGPRNWPRIRIVAASLAVYAPSMALTWGLDGKGTTTVDRLMGDTLVGTSLERIALVAAGCSAVLFLFALFDALPVRVMAPLAFFGTRSVGIYAIHKRIIYLTLEFVPPGFWIPFAAAIAVSTTMTMVIERVPFASWLLLGRRPLR